MKSTKKRPGMAELGGLTKNKKGQPFFCFGFCLFWFLFVLVFDLFFFKGRKKEDT